MAGTPYDDGDPETDDSLTHTLAGEAADAFVIDAATGQITVKQGATLDYGIKASIHRNSDLDGAGPDRYCQPHHPLTGVVPGKPGAPTLTRTMSSEPMDPALDVAWTAPGANGLIITGYQVQYRKKAAEGEEAATWDALQPGAVGLGHRRHPAGAGCGRHLRGAGARGGRKVPAVGHHP